jgi:hypothetical protein
MMKLTDKEAREKRHNPWYCKVCRKLVYISYGITGIEKDPAVYNVPFCPVCGSLDVVEKLDRETPKEFEDRTGRPWADDSAVYIKVGKNTWRMVCYSEAQFISMCCEDGVSCKIYCANSDAGIPKNEAENEK